MALEEQGSLLVASRTASRPTLGAYTLAQAQTKVLEMRWLPSIEQLRDDN